MTIFAARLRARETAYHKQIAEDDIARLARARAANADDPRALLGEPARLLDRTSSPTTSSSDRTSSWSSKSSPTIDTLAAVHAEEVRLFGDETRARATRHARVALDFHRTPSTSGNDASVANAPRSSIFDAQSAKINRRDWLRDVSEDLRRRAEERRLATPMERLAMETTHQAQKHALVAGVRALAYGTALAVVGVACGSAAASVYLSIDSSRALAEKFRETFGPAVARARAIGDRYKTAFDFDKSSTGEFSSKASLIERSAFVQSLRAKLNRSTSRGSTTVDVEPP